MGLKRSALVASVVLAAGLASPAFAQGGIEMEGDAPADPPPTDAAPPLADAPVVKDPKVAKTWTTAGDTLMKKGDALTKQGKAAEAKPSYENAATAYRKAIEATDDVVALQLQLASALDKSGDPIGAMKVLKLVVAQTGKPDLGKKAETKLDELSMKIGVVTLTIAPEGTAISLGGKPIGEAPLTEPLVLMPGTHTLTLTAVGYQPKGVELKIEAGSESERKIELEPVPMGAAPITPEVEVAPPKEPKAPSLLPIYIGGGATVGLVLIGTVTGIAAIGRHGQFDDSVSETERKDLRSSGKTLALITDLCLVGAIGAAAFTTYWYMYKYRPVSKALAERQAARHAKGTPLAAGPSLRSTTRPMPRAKVDVVPWVQPDTGGLMAVGSF